MPYDSDAQRRFMHARHPGIAARWDEEIREGKRRKRKGEVGKSLAELGEIAKIHINWPGGGKASAAARNVFGEKAPKAEKANPWKDLLGTKRLRERRAALKEADVAHDVARTPETDKASKVAAQSYRRSLANTGVRVGVPVGGAMVGTYALGRRRAQRQMAPEPPPVVDYGP